MASESEALDKVKSFPDARLASYDSCRILHSFVDDHFKLGITGEVIVQINEDHANALLKIIDEHSDLRIRWEESNL